MARRFACSAGSVGWMVLLAIAGACASPSSSANRSTAPWLHEGVTQGLPMPDPLALRPETREEIRIRASTIGSERSQLRRLLRYLVDDEGLGFLYRASHTLTAEEAYAAREGDCMSYAMLFVAAARSLGLHVHFVRITEIPVYWGENGRFFTSSHIAVAHGHDTWLGEAVVVDFTAMHTSAWRFALYDAMDDDTAVVLFHSNRAVEAMLAGRTGEAERLLRYLADRAPGVPEVFNNLGVVLMREDRMGEAVDFYARALARFPRFMPLYSNAVSAAGRAGRTELAAAWAAAGQEVADSDPAFHFSEGMRAFRRRDFGVAARQFERALSSQPDDPTLLAWAARAYLSAGDVERGRARVERIRRQKPSPEQTVLLRDLESEFPTAFHARAATAS
jgi:Flp pilus assembly protein TadD